MGIKTRREYVVMTTTNVLTRVSNLPDELMRIIYLYIPDRVPFKKEFDYIFKRKHFIRRGLVEGRVYEGRVYRKKGPSYYERKYNYESKILKNYVKIKNLNIYALREIAHIHKIKGRSKLKSRKSLITAFLKNDVDAHAYFGSSGIF